LVTPVRILVTGGSGDIGKSRRCGVRSRRATHWDRVSWPFGLRIRGRVIGDPTVCARAGSLERPLLLFAGRAGVRPSPGRESTVFAELISTDDCDSVTTTVTTVTPSTSTSTDESRR